MEALKSILSFLNTEMAQVVEILSRVWKGPVHPIYKLPSTAHDVLAMQRSTAPAAMVLT